MKMHSDVYSGVGTPHAHNDCEDVYTRVGKPHIKMYSNVLGGDTAQFLTKEIDVVEWVAGGWLVGIA